MSRPSDVDYRDPDAAPIDPGTGQPVPMRERRARIVREIAAAGRAWYPLREEVQALVDHDAPIPDDLRDRLAVAEREYRVLEDELRSLMRPRVKDEWLYGGHRHGPDDDHGH